ncbi:MAG: PadR family transcriptional regulator [Bacillota bacterium]
MDVQLKKGLMSTCVLAIVAREDTYGYKITQDTIQLLDASESALYPVLKRLEAQNYLTTYSKEYGGRLRRYYSITDVGRVQLVEAKKELEEFKKVIDFIMEGGSEK